MVQYYKSKIFMPIGMILIAAAVAVIGSLLSFIYLKINQVCPSAYLCIVCAVLFGTALGGVAYVLIKLFKIRSVASAVVGMIIGCLIFTVFKWALYVQWDCEDNIYNSMKSVNAASYIGFNIDFTDEDGNLLTNEAEINETVAILKSIPMTNYIEYYSADFPEGVDSFVEWYNKNFYDSITAKQVKESSYFDIFYPPEFIDEDNVAGCIKAASEMNLYEYVYDYIGVKKAYTVSYLVTHPSEFWQQIKNINKDGRWSLSANHSYTSSSTSNLDEFKGIELWIVWIGEIFLICVPAIVIAARRAGKPFIESEKKWAKVIESDGLALTPPTFTAGMQNAIKSDPEVLLTYEPMVITSGRAPRIRLELYHSTDYTECYLTVKYRSFNKKNHPQDKTLVKYIKVSILYVAKLFKHCRQHIPFSTAGLGLESDSMPTTQPAPANAYGNYTAPNPANTETVSVPDAYTTSSAQPASGLKDEKSQQDVFNEFNK